jgi:hypothetical protein
VMMRDSMTNHMAIQLVVASAGIEPLARLVSGGNSGGNFLPTFSQKLCICRVLRLGR